MINLFALIFQQSLADPPSERVMTQAVDWIENLLTGTTATIIASLAIASIGFAMLSGRIEIKRGLAVLLGCFILFGASTIANGLMAFTATKTVSNGQVSASLPLVYAKPPASSPTPSTSGYDPYAGASPQRRENVAIP